MLVVFHGLEGSSRSHYCQAFAEVAQERVGRVHCPIFAAAAVSSTTPRVPTIQAITKRLPGYWPSSVPAILGR